MSRRVNEWGFPLSEDEQIEIDVKAKEITDTIFGQSHGTNVPEQLSVPKMPKNSKNEGAMAADVTEKKKPGRPKKAIETPAAAATVKKNSDEIPEVVRDVLAEKIDLLERMIHTYDENIEALKADLTQQIADYESRKKDAGEKIRSLTAFMGGD